MLIIHDAHVLVKALTMNGIPMKFQILLRACECKKDGVGETGCVEMKMKESMKLEVVKVVWQLDWL